MLTSAFTPSALPSLRAFAFFGLYNNDMTTFSQSLETLCLQLHMLLTNVWDSDYLPDGILASACPFTLLDCDLPDFEWFWAVIKTAHHLRLYGTDPTCSDAASIQRQLADVTSRLLNDTQTSLRTIYLSPHLHPDSPLPVVLAQTRVDFLAACVPRGIEVCWEEVGDWDLDSAISPSFWRKAKAIRASTSG
ncbi:hypothetical protein JCM1840_007440 [Sporobolomyces johnsonii]